ncbi:MAG: hypothetical protein CME66_06785 [Halobacteriovoraceae bacterium]|nr:hypothetical protein [Halobacteriovoraceae bacterium]
MTKIPFILIVLAIFMSGCGDLFHKNMQTDTSDYRQFATCEMNVDAFGYILEKNIKGDILCLQENLNLFIDTVKTDRPGYISKSVLKDFILNGPMDVDPEMVGIVDSVFDLSHLIMGTERDYIYKTDVDVLLDFLVYFNQHIWKIYKLFSSKDDVNYSRHLRERQVVYNDFTLIASKLKSIYRGNREDLDLIDIEKFIFNFFKNEPETLRDIRSAMFLKRVFLGGEIWSLTHEEFVYGLDVFPILAQIAFDVAKVDSYEFQNEQETLTKIFLNDIDILRNTLFFNDGSQESVFNIYNIIDLLSNLAPDFLPVDISKYPRELMQLKNIFLGNSHEDFLAQEVYLALDHVDEVLSEANLFYRVYDFYRDELDSPDPISHDFSDFPVTNSREKRFLDHFAQIVHNYKYIKGNVTSPYYTFEYYRNANSFFQTASIEYVLKIAMSYYGKENPQARGGYDMTLDETVTMIDDFKWFLKDQGIISIGRKGGGEVQGVANNLVLMSTLFQYQSDGCSSATVCMEIPELTEFLVGLLTAVEVKDFFTDTMLGLCQDSLDQYDRISPACFRRNFIKVIETKIPGDGRSLAEYMPLLYEYLQQLTADIPEGDPITDSEEFMAFITETESFTRSCMYYDPEKTEEVYLKANDAFAVFAGLLNVESTLLRFDLDQNNNIDAYNSNGQNEVLNAYYSVYKGALIALVEGIVNNKIIARLLAKPIFQYLVKYSEVPSTSDFSSIWRFAKFILKRNKAADISRTTIATMLRTINEQSGSSDQPYKCEECWRDPTVECEPEGEPWD